MKICFTLYQWWQWKTFEGVLHYILVLFNIWVTQYWFCLSKFNVLFIFCYFFSPWLILLFPWFIVWNGIFSFKRYILDTCIKSSSISITALESFILRGSKKAFHEFSIMKYAIFWNSNLISIQLGFWETRLKY